MERSLLLQYSLDMKPGQGVIIADTIPELLQKWQEQRLSEDKIRTTAREGNPFRIILLREQEPCVIPPNPYKTMPVPPSESFDIWSFPAELIAALFGGAVPVSFAMRTLRFVSRRWNIMVMTRLPLSYSPAFGSTGDEVAQALLRFRNIVSLDLRTTINLTSRHLLAVNWSVLQSLTLSADCTFPEISLLATRALRSLSFDSPPTLNTYTTPPHDDKRGRFSKARPTLVCVKPFHISPLLLNQAAAPIWSIDVPLSVLNLTMLASSSALNQLPFSRWPKRYPHVRNLTTDLSLPSLLNFPALQNLHCEIRPSPANFLTSLTTLKGVEIHASLSHHLRDQAENLEALCKSGSVSSLSFEDASPFGVFTALLLSNICTTKLTTLQFSSPKHHFFDPVAMLTNEPAEPSSPKITTSLDPAISFPTIADFPRLRTLAVEHIITRIPSSWCTGLQSLTADVLQLSPSLLPHLSKLHLLTIRGAAEGKRTPNEAIFFSKLGTHLPQLQHLSLDYTCYAEFFYAIPVRLVSLSITGEASSLDHHQQQQVKELELSFEQFSHLEELRIEGVALSLVSHIVIPSSLRSLYAMAGCTVSFKSVSNLRNLHLQPVTVDDKQDTTKTTKVVDLLQLAPLRVVGILVCKGYFESPLASLLKVCPSARVLLLSSLNTYSLGSGAVERILQLFPQLRMLINSSNMSLFIPPHSQARVVRAVAKEH